MYDADKIGGNAIFEDFDLDGDKDLLTFQQNNFPLMMYENISGNTQVSLRK